MVRGDIGSDGAAGLLLSQSGHERSTRHHVGVDDGDRSPVHPRQQASGASRNPRAGLDQSGAHVASGAGFAVAVDSEAGNPPAQGILKELAEEESSEWLRRAQFLMRWLFLVLFVVFVAMCAAERGNLRTSAPAQAIMAVRLTMVVMACVGLAVPTLSVVVFVLVGLLNAIAMPLAETSGVQVVTGRSLLITTVYFSGCVSWLFPRPRHSMAAVTFPHSSTLRSSSWRLAHMTTCGMR